MSEATSYTDRFSQYFSRDVAERAARSIANGAEMLFEIADSSGAIIESFTFTRSSRHNQVIAGPAQDPQISFRLTPAAAEEILSNASDDIGEIGIQIAKLAISSDANRRVSVRFRAGFLSLFGKGYFGVLAAGGSAFASFLASRGLGGMGAIKAALKKGSKT
jgi:hypothetical protein